MFALLCIKNLRIKEENVEQPTPVCQDNTFTLDKVSKIPTTLPICINVDGEQYKGFVVDSDQPLKMKREGEADYINDVFCATGKGIFEIRLKDETETPTQPTRFNVVPLDKISGEKDDETVKETIEAGLLYKKSSWEGKITNKISFEGEKKVTQKNVLYVFNEKESIITIKHQSNSQIDTNLVENQPQVSPRKIIKEDEKGTDPYEDDSTDTDQTQDGGDTDQTQDCGDTDQTQVGGDTDPTQVGGDTDPTQVGGDTDPTQVGDDTDPTQVGGDTDPTQVGDDTDPTQVGGDTDQAQVGGDTDPTQVGGDTDPTQVGDDTDQTQVGDDTDQAQGGDQKDPVIPDAGKVEKTKSYTLESNQIAHFIIKPAEENDKKEQKLFADVKIATVTAQKRVTSEDSNQNGFLIKLEDNKIYSSTTQGLKDFQFTDFLAVPKDGGKNNNDDDSDLSVGAIVGIVIGVVVAVGAAAFCIVWFVVLKKKCGGNQKIGAKSSSSSQK